MPETLQCRRLSSNAYPKDWRRAAPLKPLASSLSHPVEPGVETYRFLKVVFQLPKKQAETITEEDKFKKLVQSWRTETRMHSSLNKKVMHPSYQRIIGMGRDALPLILREMKVNPGHWFWALDAITQGEESPAKDCESITEAARAWIKWGEDRNLL